MIGIDTNLLVYSHRKDSGWNEQARSCITELANGKAAWCIPWPCLHEFLAVVTHPRIFDPPSTVAQGLAQVEAWLESPSLVTISEDVGYWEFLAKCVRAGKVTGPRVHDARIAAVCAANGVRELWSADRDFGRFAIKVRNPLIDPPRGT